MSDKLNTDRIKQTPNEYLPFVWAIVLTPICSIIYANPSIGNQPSQVITNISTANKLQTVSALINNKFATTFDELAMNNLRGGNTANSKKIVYKLDVRSQDLAIIGAKPLNRKLYGYNGAVLRFKTDRGLDGTVSILCRSQDPGADGTYFAHAPVADAAGKLRCATGWKDILAPKQ
ncbi:type IV pilin-like G/H family protein [Chamaesiphon polymorphus]|uniref:General secretion pathway protein GspH n=1 Tax=Chamaesiphon polymorphus CCALA 037 TaxID=2107692 RepID=A0A2T1GD85_9CYAN|nr:type IV pilin-like G/H family protein [Chamaesiphon polymorphus]PSB55352.1 hypothetical protein C7B77_15315 [Chamaesiphon polymorphus CCALA 037]